MDKEQQTQGSNPTNKQVSKRSNTEAISKKETGISSLGIDKIETLQQAEEFANYIAKSQFAENFVRVIRGEDGKDKREVNVSSIVACLVLGQEIGLKPMESIAVGRMLDRNAVIKVHRGKDLGLNPFAAIQNIHIFSTGGGNEIVYLGIHVVEKVLTEMGVRRDIIDDGTKDYIRYFLYSKNNDGEEVEYDESKYFLISGASAEDVKKNIAAGKKPVIRKRDRRGLIKLIRGDQSIAIPYYLTDAIEAGLYRGINSLGEEVKGKDNWHKHLATHLRKMSTMLGARIIAADRLSGIYVDSEIDAIKVSKANYHDAVDVEYAETVDTQSETSTSVGDATTENE